MTSPTNTGMVGTRPEQPPGTAHPHMDPTLQPQKPFGASTHGHQPAASRAAATQAHPEPRPRHGTPDRPTAGPANAPPEDPPTQTGAATLTDTTITRSSDTVHPQVHNPTEGPKPQAPATSSTTAPGDLPATAQAEPASQRHHAPPAGPVVRPTELHLPATLPPTQTQVRTRHAPSSRLTPRGPRTPEADPGRRPCWKTTPKMRRDRRTIQPRRPHRQANHNARSPQWARRTCRDRHNGQQHHHQWGNLAGEWTSQQYRMPTHRAWRHTAVGRHQPLANMVPNLKNQCRTRGGGRPPPTISPWGTVRRSRGCRPLGERGASHRRKRTGGDAATGPSRNPREVRDPGNHTQHAPTRGRQGNVAQRTQPRRRLFPCLHGVLHG